MGDFGIPQQPGNPRKCFKVIRARGLGREQQEQKVNRLAGLVRQRLGSDALQLPLPKILQGGTWAAGRAIAQRLRADGSPPLRVISDGTVF